MVPHALVYRAQLGGQQVDEEASIHLLQQGAVPHDTRMQELRGKYWRDSDRLVRSQWSAQRTETGKASACNIGLASRAPCAGVERTMCNWALHSQACRSGYAKGALRAVSTGRVPPQAHFSIVLIIP